MIPLDYVQYARLKLVVVGGSAGAIPGIEVLLSGLMVPVAVAVVLHLAEHQAGVLPRLFRATPRMPVVEPLDKQQIVPGTVYFAPAGYHLLVETDGSFALSVGPRVYNCRPSIDVLFETASAAYGSHLAAIVLSGANSDGAAGAKSVAQRGGLVLVQDPNGADAKQMPSATLSSASVHFVGSVQEIRNRLAEMGPRHERIASDQHLGR